MERLDEGIGLKKTSNEKRVSALIGLSFLYSGNVRFPLTPSARIYLSSVTGNARNPFARGKPFDARHTTAPPATRDLPTTLRTNSRFTVSPTSGSSVHFASNSS